MTNTLLRIGLAVWLAAGLAGCAGGAAAPPTPTPLPATTAAPPSTATWTATTAPTDTPVPPTATATATATATQTPTATDTPAPTATPTEAVSLCPPGSGGPPGRQVRLTIVNKSGADIFMKLEQCGGDAFYYLTVPAGTMDNPTTKVLSMPTGFYQRTTIQCGGVESRGILPLDGNIRLNFTSCGAAGPTATAEP